MKNQKGITLVALIITVIVMLILAGVSIAMTLNNDGLFQKTQNAVNQYQDKVDQMESDLEELNTKFDQLYGNYSRS